MKKSILTLGLMFAALTLTNCTKNEEENIVPETKGQAFELFANADTRTTIDGVATSWAADDALNVFHADAGTTTYTKDNKFSIAEADVTSGRFTGTLAGTLEEGKNYDWYISYPYNDNIKSPNASQGWMTVGSAHNASQTQNGNNSMAHICGENYPLCAKVLNVAAADKVAFEKMNHLTSVVKVKVTNTESEAITVSKVSFATSSNDIVGTYKINFTGDDVAYTASGASYVSKTASLDVVGGTPIEKDANAEFYLGIKPFTAAAGETLTITVSTDKGDCVKTLELPNATTFTAGRIKTLNFGFVAQKPKIYELVTDASTLAEGDQVIIVSTYKKLSAYYAMGNTQNNNNRSAETVTIVNGNDNTYTITNPSSGVQIFTLQYGSKQGTFAFYTGNGYIYAAGGGNYLRTDTDISDNSSWLISSSADTNSDFGTVASIVAQGTNTPKNILYNSSTTPTVFSCYNAVNTTIKTVTIFRLQDDREPLVKPAITVTLDNTNKSITVSWETVDNATSYVVSCTGQTEQTLGADATECTFSGLEYGKYTVTVTASADGYRSSSASEEGIEIIDYNLAKPLLASVTGTTEKITATWAAVQHAKSYIYKLNKLKDNVETTVIDETSYGPTDSEAETVTLTIEGPFTAGEQYVLYVKSATGETADYKPSEDFAKSEPFEIKDAGAEPELVTVEMSTFTATSDNIDTNISYTTAKGGGTTNPAINGGQIRLYQNSAGTGGGTITITAKDGFILTSVTIGSSMGTSIAYTIGDSTTKSTTESLSANGKKEVTVNDKSITFYCMGKTSSTRLYVNYLSATYQAQ